MIIMRILGICRVAMLLAIAAFVLKPEAVADDRVLAVRCIRAKQAELESPGAIIGVPLHIQINTLLSSVQGQTYTLPYPYCLRRYILPYLLHSSV